MRVLIIAYHFPPDAEVGALRPYQFARLLPQQGIEPWVLTVQAETLERRDESFQPEGVPAEHIIRTPVGLTRRMNLIRMASALKNSFRPQQASFVASAAVSSAALPGSGVDFSSEGWLRATPRRRWLLEWLRFPDAMQGWRRPALAAAEELLKQHKFDVIISTSPPRVVHLIALELAKRHNLPWVMDLRDPWYKDTDELDSPMLERAYNRLFVPCVKRADKIVLNTTRLMEHMHARWPESQGKNVAIPNGCNVSSQPDLQPSPVALSQFTIGHFGSVYSKRDPGPFLRGLRLWLDRHEKSGAVPPIRVRFVGPEFGTVPELVSQLKLASVVSLEPPVQRGQVPQLMQEAYVLLLLANKQEMQVPAKLYEYLAARRRILATADGEGSTSDLLKDASGAVMAFTEDQVGAALDSFWQQYSSGQPADISNDTLLDECSYTRRTEKLAEVLRSVAISR